MKIARARKDNQEFFAIVENSTIIRISGNIENIFSNTYQTLSTHKLDEVELLAPVMPSKIVCVGKNYSEHAKEMNEGEPTEPLLFLKPNTCIIGNECEIVYPILSKRVDFEGELGVVIGVACKEVSESEAMNYVLGYTCLNDVTARDIQKGDMQWTRGKSFDTFCPIGPFIETDLQADNLCITTRLNGEVKQKSNTSCMTHSVAKLISYISQVMTLLPGDIVATGTPKGVGPMQAGDEVEVEIEGIGILKSTVVSIN